MALSGRINGSVTLNSWCFSYYILWSATQDPVANTSTITASTYWSTSDLGMTFDTVGNRSASITIDGSTDSISQRFVCNPWPSNGIFLIQTYTKTVNHDADGTKSLTISARSNGTASSYGPSASTASSNDCTASATITLDAIDRTEPEITLSLASRTANSLTISATASASCDIWEYKVDSGSWTQFSTTDATAVSCVLTGLSPSVTYGVQIRGRKTFNHVVGTSAQYSFGTLGAATINSATEIYADASSVIVSVNAEIYNASYTYSLAIKRDTTTIITLTFPAMSVGTHTLTATLTASQKTNLLAGMADVASFSATYVLTSVNSGSTVGSSSTTAMIRTSATTSAPNAPTFSYKDSNASTVAVTSDNTKLIQGQSTLQLTSLSSTAKNGASIASYTIVVGGVTVTDNSGGTVNIGTIPQSGTLSLVVTAKDTRGYTASTTVNVTCYAYALPSVSSGTAKRDDIDADHVGLSFTGTYSAVGNNTVTAKYKYKKTSDQSYSADTSITITASSGLFSYTNGNLISLDPDESYDFVLTIADKLNSEVYNFVVPQYAPLIGYRAEGIGINKVPRSGYSVDIKGKVGISNVSIPDANNANKYLGLDANGDLEFKDVNISSSYDDLSDRPQIESVTLTGNKSFADLGIGDYIVEQGTEGSWVYRKYNSGVAECWGSFTVSVTGWTSWGSIYEATRSTNLAPDYPTDLFTATPVLNVNVWHPSIGTLGVELYGTHSKSVVPSIIPLRPNTGSTGQLGVYIHSVGTWK